MVAESGARVKPQPMVSTRGLFIPYNQPPKGGMGCIARRIRNGPVGHAQIQEPAHLKGQRLAFGLALGQI
jgi:hypothetical protein